MFTQLISSSYPLHELGSVHPRDLGIDACCKYGRMPQPLLQDIQRNVVYHCLNCKGVPELVRMDFEPKPVLHFFEVKIYDLP